MSARLAVLVLLVLGLAAAPVAVRGQSLSGVPAAFVDVGLGARPVALGSAYIGVADDIHSIVWNPAGLGRQSGLQASFSYTRLLGLFEYQYAAVGGALPGGPHAVGLAVVASGDDAFREMTVFGSYARAVGRLGAGVNLKYRRASFGDNTMDPDDLVVFDQDEIGEGIANQMQGDASGFALDLGLQYRIGDRSTLGVMLRDVFAPVSWDAQTAGGDVRDAYDERVPFELAIGTAYEARAGLVVSADYQPALTGDLDDRVRLGAEAQILQVLALRGGLQQAFGDRSTLEYALGFGLLVPIGGDRRISADYSYLGERLADSHHLTLAVRL